MKKIRLLSFVIALLLFIATLAGCSAEAPNKDGFDGDDGFLGGDGFYGGDGNFDEMENAPSKDEEMYPIGPEGDSNVPSFENPFISTEKNPTSTFSADVDTASYAYFRKLVEKGDYSLDSLKNAVEYSPLRTEEMVNYFDYSHALPEGDEIFGVSATVAKTPWNNDSYLLVLGLTTEQLEAKGENNLVFLIDVSGSMAASDKLPLLKTAFSHLVSALDENDTVSIVTYAGEEKIVLSGCKGNRGEEILQAVNSLEAMGSTNGEAGINMAYSVARDYYKPEGNNRIIMASDGDLNVGISDPDELCEFISEKKDEGIFLSVLGFGTGNYKDSSMSALAQNGNGVYYYIDGEMEAEKVLCDELLSTLYTVAKDVKLQLTFNAQTIDKYRLVGYENRILNNEDFDDDTKDAGDVGAGHSLTVCYEIILKDGAADGGEVFDISSLSIRYKQPNENESQLREFKIDSGAMTDKPSDDFNFICAVIETAMIVNNSAYNAKKVTLDDVLASLKSNNSVSKDVYKREFCTLIQSLLERQGRQ